MANPQTTRTAKPDYAPPPVDGDFYRIAAVLNDERAGAAQGAFANSRKAWSRR